MPLSKRPAVLGILAPGAVDRCAGADAFEHNLDEEARSWALVLAERATGGRRPLRP
jgi:hypothetical protein